MFYCSGRFALTWQEISGRLLMITDNIGNSVVTCSPYQDTENIAQQSGVGLAGGILGKEMERKLNELPSHSAVSS